MAQKGQKQEGMSCGEVCAVCGFHTQGNAPVRSVKDVHRHLLRCVHFLSFPYMSTSDMRFQS